MTDAREQRDVDVQVLKMREEGASWLDVARTLNLTRQQARYAYQRAKREARRSAKREN